MLNFIKDAVIVLNYIKTGKSMMKSLGSRMIVLSTFGLHLSKRPNLSFASLVSSSKRNPNLL
jgi:hypothetical protein